MVTLWTVLNFPVVQLRDHHLRARNVKITFVLVFQGQMILTLLTEFSPLNLSSCFEFFSLPVSYWGKKVLFIPWHFSMSEGISVGCYQITCEQSNVERGRVIRSWNG